MVATENVLQLGCTLCPSYLIAIPWMRSLSITVAWILSAITIIGLALLVAPFLLIKIHMRSYMLISLPSCPSHTPPPPRWVPSIFVPNFILLVPSVHSELVYIGLITSLPTGVNTFASFCVSRDSCAVIVFNLCHLWLPICITSVAQWKCASLSETLFKVLQKE